MKIKFTYILFLIFFLIALNSCWPTRDGNKLYKDFFGTPIKGCAEIMEFRDHQAVDDASAYLYFKLCPSELKRILSQNKYIKEIITRKEALEHETITYSGGIPKWWTPSKLGDSCIRYHYVNQDEKRREFLYVSNDSTTVYYVDQTGYPYSD